MFACVRLVYFCVAICLTHSLSVCVCVRACVRACVHVLDCVVSNSENVQTVYKISKLMYWAVVQMFVKIFVTLFMSASIIYVHFCL